jgi:hypothetical protein
MRFGVSFSDVVTNEHMLCYCVAEIQNATAAGLSRRLPVYACDVGIRRRWLGMVFDRGNIGRERVAQSWSAGNSGERPCWQCHHCHLPFVPLATSRAPTIRARGSPTASPQACRPQTSSICMEASTKQTTRTVRSLMCLVIVPIPLVSPNHPERSLATEPNGNSDSALDVCER